MASPWSLVVNFGIVQKVEKWSVKRHVAKQGIQKKKDLVKHKTC